MSNDLAMEILKNSMIGNELDFGVAIMKLRQAGLTDLAIELQEEYANSKHTYNADATVPKFEPNPINFDTISFNKFIKVTHNNGFLKIDTDLDSGWRAEYFHFRGNNLTKWKDKEYACDWRVDQFDFIVKELIGSNNQALHVFRNGHGFKQSHDIVAMLLDNENYLLISTRQFTMLLKKNSYGVYHYDKAKFPPEWFGQPLTSPENRRDFFKRIVDRFPGQRLQTYNPEKMSYQNSECYDYRYEVEDEDI